MPPGLTPRPQATNRPGIPGLKLDKTGIRKMFTFKLRRKRKKNKIVFIDRNSALMRYMLDLESRYGAFADMYNSYIFTERW